MCTFESNVLGTILNAAVGVSNEALNIINEKKNNEYRTRVALNNAKIAQSEALRQKQLGIEKSRLEKIQGIQDANRQKASYAASNLDINSFSNQLNYDDSLYSSDFSADAIQKEYDAKAQSYFNQANSYYSQAQNQQRLYNNSVFQNALNAIGKTGKVSSEWYEQKTNNWGIF